MDIQRPEVGIDEHAYRCGSRRDQPHPGNIRTARRAFFATRVHRARNRALGEIGWTDIEILDEEGAPVVQLHGNGALLAAKLGLSGWSVSLSHTTELAIAFVVAW